MVLRFFLKIETVHILVRGRRPPSQKKNSSCIHWGYMDHQVKNHWYKRYFTTERYPIPTELLSHITHILLLPHLLSPSPVGLAGIRESR